MSLATIDMIWDRLPSVVDMRTHLLENPDKIESNLIATRLQGFKRICGSLRFDPYSETAGDFICRRSVAIDGFEKAKKLRDFAQIVPGALFKWYDGILDFRAFDCLTVGNTDLILLEMPEVIWNQRTLETLCLLARKDFRFVITHMERHLNNVSVPSLCILKDEGILVECGTPFFFEKRYSKAANLFLRNNLIDMVGSGMGEGEAVQNLGPAFERILDGYGEEGLDPILRFYEGSFPLEEEF